MRRILEAIEDVLPEMIVPIISGAIGGIIGAILVWLIRAKLGA